MRTKTKRIGLLGGTFDPPHNGHVSIARSFLESGKIDQLWIVVSPDPPHKSGEFITDFDTRYRLCKAAFKDTRKVKVTRIEFHLPPPHYTVKTLAYLNKTHPDYNFYWCLGGDSLSDFEHWYKYRKILSLSELLVARRPNSNFDHLDPIILKHSHFVDHTPIELSSTEIRHRVADGGSIAGDVPPNVETIIKERELYRHLGNGNEQPQSSSAEAEKRKS
jgi:nicotinate-nucleotide adenylyltransferase